MGEYYIESGMATDTVKVAIGALLLVVASALILGTGVLGSPLPVWTGGVAVLALAVGALLVGVSGRSRPV